MATRRVNTGRRFGDEKPVQRNRENRPEGDPNRSPGESNANRYMPSVREDTDVMFPKDVERVRRSLSPTGRGAARQSQVDAGARAGGRMLGRAGYAGLAFEAGRTAGDALVDKAIEKMSEGKVKLSDYAKQRMREEEDFQAMQKALRAADKEKEEMRKGGMVKKMAKGGEVKKKTEAKKPAPVFDKKMKPEDMPPNKAAMDMMREWEDKEKRRKMGERYEQIMPPAGLAKGGAVQQAKVGKVMKEFKEGTLHSGAGGKVVKSPRQAIAIALSEARRMKKK